MAKIQWKGYHILWDENDGIRRKGMEISNIDTAWTALYFLCILGAECFASFVREDSRLTPKVDVRIIQKGSGRTPNGAAIVRSAFLTQGISLSGLLQSHRFGEV